MEKSELFTGGIYIMDIGKCYHPDLIKVKIHEVTKTSVLWENLDCRHENNRVRDPLNKFVSPSNDPVSRHNLDYKLKEFLGFDDEDEINIIEIIYEYV